jgi:general secretion pathway protein D
MPRGPRHHDRSSFRPTAALVAVLILWAFAILSSGCEAHPPAVAGRQVRPAANQPSPPAKERPRQSAALAPKPPAAPTPLAAAPRVQSPAPAERPACRVPEPKLIPSEPVAPAGPEQASPPSVAHAAQPTAGCALEAKSAGAALRAGLDPNELISVNFDNVEIRTVLKTIGEITGINFIPHDSITGTITVMSPTPIRLGEIYPFLQSVLDVHGYTMIETDNAVKVVPKAEATKSHMLVRVGADPARIPATDEIVRQILPLKYADAAEISEIITPLLGPGAQISTYARTNSLVLTDTSANIRHLAEVIQRLDVEGSREKVQLYPLTHASAQVLSEQILRILDKTKTALPGLGRPQAIPVPGNGPRVLPDDRTNSLIVIASEQEAETIAGLVHQLDIERPLGTDRVHVVYLKNADANEVARSLDRAVTTMKLAGAVPAAAPQIQITPDPSTNALVIVAPPSDFDVLSQIVEKLDIVREQVLVEMLILEVSQESLLNLGIDWATLDEPSANSVRGFGMTNFGPRLNFLSGTAEGLSIGAWQAVDGAVQIAAILEALEKQSGVNILSTPSILASNHRKAKIIVGENRPFVTQSRITESTDPLTPTVIKTFEYKDVGITLDITPHVSQGGMIRLEIKSEFTKLIEDVTSLSLDTPTTAKRTAQTVVTMGSGATVVIGGLIRDDTIKTVKKVPLLGDIPLLGALFQAQSHHKQKTNLLLFITPRVLSSQEELQEMTDQKKQQMDEAREESH